MYKQLESNEVKDEKKINQGQRLSEFRREVGFTQADFSEKLDIQAAHLSHIEKGRRSISYDLITKLSCWYSNLNLNWLLNGVGAMFTKEYEWDFNEMGKAQSYYEKSHWFFTELVNTENTITKSQLQESRVPIYLPWIEDHIVSVFSIGGPGPWLKAGEVVFCRPVKASDSEGGLHIVWMKERLRALNLERVDDAVKIEGYAEAAESLSVAFLADDVLMWKVIHKYTDELENVKPDDLLQDVLRRLAALEGRR